MKTAKITVNKRLAYNLTHGSDLVTAKGVKSGSGSKGQLAEVYDEQENFIGKGYLINGPNITLKIFSRNKDEKIDKDFFNNLIKKADDFRQNTLKLNNSYRLFYSETDGFPDLIIERYNNIAVFKTTSIGAELWKDTIADILIDLPFIKTVVEKNDGRNRLKENLPIIRQVVRGEQTTKTVILEGIIKFEVDLIHGQKTGSFLDQRENHIYLSKLAKPTDTVLDMFTYTGGFALHAASVAKEVTALDIGKEAINQAKKNAELNNFKNMSFIQGDAFEESNKLIEQKKQYDIVIVDPPAFAQSHSQKEKAEKAYTFINLNALKLIKPGGILVACSCSHFIEKEDFRKIIKDAASIAKRKVSLIKETSQAPDHLIDMKSDTTEYLKCLFVKVD